MADYRVISADSHVDEPEDLYDRLPPEYWERRPRVEKLDGVNWLVIDGQAVLPSEAPNPLTEEDKRREFRSEGGTLNKGRYDGTDISRRLSDMDEDGVSGEVIYPNGIFHCFVSPDPSFQMASAQLYNDFYGEVFGEHTDMFLPSAILPTVNVNAASAEVERVAKMGYRSLSVPVSPSSTPYYKQAYDPLWSTIERSGIPLSFHVFTESEARPVEKLQEERGTAKVEDGTDLIFMVLGMAEAMSPMLMLTASGALDRHPDLKFVLVECGTGWLAWTLYAMDDVYKRRHMWQVPKLEMTPSEYFRRQGYITFGDDPIGLHNIEFTGADSMMWGSDYPHDEGTFPHSREVIEETFKELTEEEKRKIVGENAAKLYGFSLD